MEDCRIPRIVRIPEDSEDVADFRTLWGPPPPYIRSVKPMRTKRIFENCEDFRDFCLLCFCVSLLIDSVGHAVVFCSCVWVLFR